jgi:hypothetical protein
MNERQLLVDCLRRLNRAGVTYYLTGSMASNYWGIPRTTHDLDFVVQLPGPAVPRIVREFSQRQCAPLFSRRINLMPLIPDRR